MSATVDRIRAFVYQTFARSGHAPDWATIAREVDVPSATVAETVRLLADRHALILTPDGAAIERALPFSAVPTPFRVRSEDGNGSWWANCVWDALAIPPLLGCRAIVETTCADCDVELRFRMDPVDGPSHPEWTAHFLLPAARWYHDIRFT